MDCGRDGSLRIFPMLVSRSTRSMASLSCRTRRWIGVHIARLLSACSTKNLMALTMYPLSRSGRISGPLSSRRGSGNRASAAISGAMFKMAWLLGLSRRRRGLPSLIRPETSVVINASGTEIALTTMRRPSSMSWGTCSYSPRPLLGRHRISTSGKLPPHCQNGSNGFSWTYGDSKLSCIVFFRDRGV